jgi:glycosyltransferase involved in cell wall biosynthesis
LHWDPDGDKTRTVKIAYIAAGAGGMYCGSCIRDNALARELSRLGHPTLLIPTYTPLRTDEEGFALPRVFYGGLGVYLSQKFRLLRRPVPLLDRALARPGLLRLIGKMSFSTKPEALGDLLVSVLRGEDGNQRKSLEELAGFLSAEVRPDVVHLTNSLLSGLAAPLKRRLDGVPVVASFQGEDLFLQGLTAEDRARALDLIREAAGSIDAFTAVSAHTAELMARWLGMDRRRITVIPPGIRLDGYPPPGPRPPVVRPFTIGYLARLAPEKGMAVLVEAFRILREDLAVRGAPARPDRPGLPRIVAAGYIDAAGRPFMRTVERRLRSLGLSSAFAYIGEVDRAEKIAFLGRIDVLSVPSTYPEAKGTPAIEALACGVPVVLPRSGAYPEIVEATGGGILVEPGDPAALAAGIRKLIADPALAEDLGRRGAEAVRREFTVEAMARSTLKVYEGILATSKLIAGA